MKKLITFAACLVFTAYLFPSENWQPAPSVCIDKWGIYTPINLVKLKDLGICVITSNHNGDLCIFNALNGDPICTLQGHKAFFYSAKTNFDGSLIISCSALDHTARIWDIANRKLLLSLWWKSHYITSVGFSSDEPRIITSEPSSPQYLWGTKSMIGTLSNAKLFLGPKRFSRDGSYIAEASGNTVHIWNAVNGELIHTLEHPTGSISTMEFSPDGSHIATAALIEGNKNRPQFPYSWELDPNTNKVIRRPNEGNFYSTLSLWDAKTGEPTYSLKALTQTGESNPSIYTIGFNANGTRIATAAGDTLHLWNSDGRCIATLKSPPLEEIYKIVFSSDSSSIVTLQKDRIGSVIKVRRWHNHEKIKLKNNRCLAFACSLYPRLCEKSRAGLLPQHLVEHICSYVDCT